VSKERTDLQLRWANNHDNAAEFARFFVENAPSEYISHSEIQDGRAEINLTWSDKLETILTHQFLGGCRREGNGKLAETRLAVARLEGIDVAAIAYVGLERGAPVPYAILYDLLVRSDLRNVNIGSDLLAWLEKQLHEEKVVVLFLESGINNERAHTFFDRRGFSPVSINMMKAV